MRVVAHPRPTAFTIVEQGAPTIVFTTALVALLAAGELEAVAAHEVGHIASDGITESHTFDWMLDLLRILGAAILVLYLLAIRPDATTALVVFAAVVVGSAMIDHASHEWDRSLGTYADATLVLLNPLMVAANLLAYVIGYALGHAEDLLADLRAVELTRHPEALHVALRRLRDVEPSGPPLPLAYHFRYFTAEGIVPETLTPVQAPIPMRLAMLERIDPALRVAAPVRRRVATCPDCTLALAEEAIASHYGAPIPVDRCAACGGIWFDSLELYRAGTQYLIAAGERQATPPPTGASPECPRCRLPLRRTPPYGPTADVWVFDCTTCDGAWVRPADLVKFGRHRQQRAGRSAQARG
jgi:Zn-dependent protease with chaperone function